MINSQFAQSNYSDSLSSSNTTSEENGQVHLPKPDPENITVLSHNLPNKPILPWNHFDSPWTEEAPHEDEDKGNGTEVELDEVE